MATLGSKSVGSTVKLKVNGTARNFIVVHQGLPSSAYDSSCDGTWLLMEDVYASRVWDSSNNDYANSDIHSYLNNTFINLFDSDIQSVIQQIKLPYHKGTGNGGTLTTGANGLSTKVFLLSYKETSLSGNSNVGTEGAVLSYFNGASNDKRVAKLNGTATSWWLRTVSTISTTTTYYVWSGGYASNAKCTTSYGIRPALVLPTTLEVSDDGTVAVPSGAITGSVNIDGVQRELTGKGYINIGGVLHELSDSSVNIGGTLKSLKG